MDAKGNIHQKLGQFSDHWNPRIIAELNGQQVKAAKLLGAFEWHSHEEEDEMFLVVSGKLKMEFRDRTEELDQGDYIVIPKGVEHRPVADEEVEVLLFEPASTVNTGSNKSERTRVNLKRI